MEVTYVDEQRCTVVMEIADSARKHGVSDDDMLHAARFAFAEVTEVARDDFVMVIGSDRSGRLMEVGILDPDDDRPSSTR